MLLMSGYNKPPDGKSESGGKLLLYWELRSETHPLGKLLVILVETINGSWMNVGVVACLLPLRRGGGMFLIVTMHCSGNAILNSSSATG